LLIVLAVEAPSVLAFLGGVVLLAWFAVRTGTLTADDENESDPEPLTELERRYVNGELSDDEFEHRLSVLLDADERADRESNMEREVALER
jgi:uncharacterized membrane protein